MPTTATVVRLYAWAGDDLLMANLNDGNATTQTVYYGYDGNKNVTTLVDTSGNVVAVYDYDPFGNLVRMTGSWAVFNPMRFSTKYAMDNATYAGRDTGLYYYGRRFYNVALGRFNNRDPIGERGGVNLYAMCGNDCLNKIDPHGFSEIAFGPGVSGTIVLAPGYHGSIQIAKTFNFISGLPPTIKVCVTVGITVGITPGVYAGAGIDLAFGFSPNNSLEGPSSSTSMSGGVAIDASASAGIAKNDKNSNLSIGGSGGRLGVGDGAYLGFTKVFSGTSCYSGACMYISSLVPQVMAIEDTKHAVIATAQAKEAALSWLRDFLRYKP